MTNELIKQILKGTPPPYVGRVRPKKPTPRQLELLENFEAIDRRSNRGWNTGQAKPVSRFAEDYKKQIGIEGTEQTQMEAYEPDS